jgi:hypothetical protein
MQARRIEASVMTSLTELRAIEQERIADERRVIEVARAAEVAARELAERQRVEAKDARERAERDEQLRIEQARIAAEREAWLRIEQVEAAERARHAAALEQHRIEQELELRRAEVAKKRPTWMLAVTAIAVAAGFALAWFAVTSAEDSKISSGKQAQAEKVAALAKQESAQARMALEQVERDAKDIDAKLSAAQHRLDVAVTRAEQERAQQELLQIRKDRAALDKRIADDKAERERIKRLGGFHARECSKTALGCMDAK